VRLLRPAAVAALWLLLGSIVSAPPVLRPALWLARDGDSAVWLFGTVHELPRGTAWLDPAVAKALADSDTLVLELVAPTPAETAAALAASAPPPGTPPLPDRLPPGEGDRLHAAAAALGYPATAFDRGDAWAAATALSIEPLRAAGYARDDAPEALLARIATRRGMRVVGLETQGAQVAMLAALAPATQASMLKRALDHPARIVPDMARTVAAWGRGDVAAIGDAVTDGLPGDARAILLDRRNDRWATRIAGWMATPGTRFVAVGAGHLTGSGSVQTRLQAQGVPVVRVR